jgi:hypothetical protein
MKERYLVKCRGCKWWFYTYDPDTKWHKECEPVKKERQKRSKGYLHKRHSVLIRDKNTCQECGTRVVERITHVHHIDRDYKNDSLTNLVTLCASCHKMAENNEFYTKLSDFKLQPDENFKDIPKPKEREPVKKHLFTNIC